MKLFGRELTGYARLLVILIAVLLVSAGLCGLQVAVYDKSPTAIQGLFMATGALELIGLWGSVGGGAIVLLLWAGTALYAHFAMPPKDETQKLFGDGNERKHDGES